MRLDEDDMDDLAEALSELRAGDAARTASRARVARVAPAAAVSLYRTHSTDSSSACSGSQRQADTPDGSCARQARTRENARTKVRAKLASTSAGRSTGRASSQPVRSNTTATGDSESSGSCDSSAAVDADTVKVGEGLYYNHRLGANNVWEVPVDPTLVDQAGKLFYSHLHRGGTAAPRPLNGSEIEMGPGIHHEPVDTPFGGFLVKRIRDWGSDIAWISVDDPASFREFESLWRRMGIPERFAGVVPHDKTLRLFSGYYVTRTWCESHKWHFDYNVPCGTDALTMMTPLTDFSETSSFQLSYHGSAPDGTANRDELDDVRRYEYKKGSAVAFGSQFYHSTEVGESVNQEVHAYLCFAFGTDQQERWPEIAKILGQASRIVQHPNGQMHLTNLGRDQGHTFEQEPRVDTDTDTVKQPCIRVPAGESLEGRLSGMSKYLRTKTRHYAERGTTSSRA